ncbi:uncharacterized protein LOC108708049 [Xenopus laevis]|uniref:Uncharacterized protein LOC108708049 n=1 Tax=Xenopus laevis TaxID=8355 RepID=A0A8J0UD15_XENLA|nr:uncharacterized protein LOC108708049 [Xenopus laevis]
MQQEKLVTIESDLTTAGEPQAAVLCTGNFSFGLDIPSFLTHYGNHPRTDPICQRDAESETQQKNGENLRVGQCVSLVRSGHWAGGNSVQSFLWSGGLRGRGKKEASGFIASTRCPNKARGDLRKKQTSQPWGKKHCKPGPCILRAHFIRKKTESGNLMSCGERT